MKISHLVVSCATIASAVLAAPAFAEDGKAMPGSVCQPMSFRPTAPSGLATGGLTITNFGSVAETVTCPVTKDIEAGRIKRAEVKVIDANPNNGADVRCTLSSFKSDGAVHQSQLVKTQGSLPGVPQPLPFTAHTANNKGTYNLICELPPFVNGFGGSGIMMYNIVEE
jgi:hypothetical protein